MTKIQNKNLSAGVMVEYFFADSNIASKAFKRSSEC